MIPPPAHPAVGTWCVAFPWVTWSHFTVLRMLRNLGLQIRHPGRQLRRLRVGMTRGRALFSASAVHHLVSSDLAGCSPAVARAPVTGSLTFGVPSRLCCCGSVLRMCHLEVSPALSTGPFVHFLSVGPPRPWSSAVTQAPGHGREGKDQRHGDSHPTWASAGLTGPDWPHGRLLRPPRRAGMGDVAHARVQRAAPSLPTPARGL